MDSDVFTLLFTIISFGIIIWLNKKYWHYKMGWRFVIGWFLFTAGLAGQIKEQIFFKGAEFLSPSFMASVTLMIGGLALWLVKAKKEKGRKV